MKVEGSPGQPLFSVVIPTHQSRELVLAAVSSVLAQTNGDFEIIVVDNGSTDGTREAMSTIADERVHYRWQEDSGLPADSRNQGIKLARGTWICFLDADDTWRPHKLAAVHQAVTARPEVVLVTHPVQLVDPEGRPLGLRRYSLDERALHEQLLYRGNFLTTSATCVRRHAAVEAGGFDVRPEYFTVEDYDLWLRLAEKGAQAAMVDEVLGDQRVHPGSASSRLVRHYEALAVLYDDHAVKAGERGDLDLPAALTRRTRSRLAETRDLARQGDLSDALRAALSLPGEVWRTRRLYSAALRRGREKAHRW